MKRRGKNPVADFVLDASAVLAMIHGEPGEDLVRRLSSGSFVSAVNVAEVGSRLADRGVSQAEVRESIRAAGLQVAAFDADLAYVSGSLRSATRHLGLSLGDRACLALALQRALPVLTADRAWSNLNVGVDVHLIRGN